MTTITKSKTTIAALSAAQARPEEPIPALPPYCPMELAEAIAWLKSDEVNAGPRTLKAIGVVLAALSRPAAQGWEAPPVMDPDRDDVFADPPALPALQEPLTCEWWQDESDWDTGSWSSACGGDPWQFEADDPTKNGMRFCIHCGKRMVQRGIAGEQHG